MSTQLIIKNEQHSRPEDEYSYPGYKEAAARSKEFMSKMTFENEAQKKDYLKKVSASRHNIPGMPAFFPPDRIVNKHRMPTVYKCTKCDSVIEGLFAVCDVCGYQAEKCPHCNQMLYRRTDDNGREFCMKCFQTLQSQSQQERVTQ